jgi:hypothetical protein
LTKGLLPWNKVRWLTEFATPGEDGPFADYAAGGSAADARVMPCSANDLPVTLAIGGSIGAA